MGGDDRALSGKQEKETQRDPGKRPPPGQDRPTNAVRRFAGRSVDVDPKPPHRVEEAQSRNKAIVAMPNAPPDGGCGHESEDAEPNATRHALRTNDHARDRNLNQGQVKPSEECL
jgi:hypothetical protein